MSTAPGASAQMSAISASSASLSAVQSLVSTSIAMGATGPRGVNAERSSAGWVDDR